MIFRSLLCLGISCVRASPARIAALARAPLRLAKGASGLSNHRRVVFGLARAIKVWFFSKQFQHPPMSPDHRPSGRLLEHRPSSLS